MSSSSRSTARAGGKNTAVKKNESAAAVNKAHKNEAKKTESTHVSNKATAEQIRIAQTTTIDTKIDDDPKLAEKIKQAMTITLKSEEEVRLAFHDCDNDLSRALEYLISENTETQWSVTKKKRRAPSTSKPGGEAVANNHINEAEVEKEEEPEAVVTGNGAATANNNRRGGRRGGPARINDRGADTRKWKGKENKENERNASDSRGGGRDGFRRDRGDRGGRGMANGSVGRGGLGRGGRGGRGGGGRLSSRTYQPRGDKPGLSRTIDTWNNPSVENSATEKMGNWENDFPVPEEWDNEEYTGSLADSKVFTPSTAVPENSTAETMASVPPEENQDLSITKAPSPQTQQVTSGVMGMGTLTPEQTQFLSQLTQQHSQHSTDALKQTSSAVPTSTTQSNSYSSLYQTSNDSDQQNTQTNSYQSMYHPSSQSITSTYSTTSVPFPPSSYGNSMVSNYNVSLQDVTSQSQSMPPRNKPQRARVPPPSKIPSSAVEMPPADGSVSNSIGFLDVQFGGLEFGTNDTSFDSSLVNSSEQNKYSSTNTSLNSSTSVVTSLAELSLQNSSNVAPVTIDPYSNLSSVSSQQKPSQPSNVSSVLSQASKSLGTESLLQSSTDKQSSSTMGSYSSQSASQGVRSTSTALQDLAAKAAANTASVGAGEVPSLSSYGVPDTAGSYNQQSSATSVYQKPNSSSVSYHQPSQSLGSSYNASSYSNPSQVTSSSIAYSSGGNQSQGSSYTPVTNSSYNSQQSSYTSNSSYQPSSNYSTYPSYPNSQTYQNNSGGQSGGYQNQSSYGSGNTSSLSGNSSSYGAAYPNTYNSSNTSASQQNHKISSSSLSSSSVSKESQVKYDTGSSAITTAAPALSSLSQTTISSTKVSSTSTGAKSGMVTGLPPGVPPQMMGTQYIMSQGNVPAYFQQPIYSFEDLHMIPQRLPPVPAGYYDISAASYQAPTSLAAGRDGMPNVAYSMSDARFTRTDNNASPVSSTISQQNASQAHQQPLMNPAFQPSYATYYIAGTPSVLQPNFYGPPGALYPMTPTASAGGHSTATSGQYGKGPGAYGTAAGYGTGYDANGLSGQTGSDYKGSGGYANSQSASGKGVTTTNNPTQTTSASASDLGTANMYSKSQHSVLAKVNSYDKQGFHSGNPPPFPMPGNQSAGAYPPVFISGIPPSSPMVQSAHALHVDLRNPARRTDSSNTAGSRTPASAQPNKTGSKPSYSTSNFWPQN